MSVSKTPAIRLATALLLSLTAPPFMAAVPEADHACSMPAAAIDALFTRFDEGVQPGAAVLVMLDGEVRYARGHGYADLETRVPITPRSTFRLASVSKQFTALAIAILAERGALDIDDPVARYVPVLSPYPGITLRHLLTHTSGLPDYYDSFDAGPWVERGGLPTNADAMTYLGQMGEPLFEPGARYEYSNPAYEALAVAVEAVTGKSFAAFMKDELFTPAGMSGSLIHDHTRPAIAHRVVGYRPTEDGFERYDDDPLNGIIGSGGQYSTLEDFVAWNHALDGGRLVSPAMREQVYARARLNDGQEIDYGFGWRIERYRGHPRMAHSGSWIGFRTAIARYPGPGLAVVILSNRADYEPADDIDRLTDLCLG